MARPATVSGGSPRRQLVQRPPESRDQGGSDDGGVPPRETRAGRGGRIPEEFGRWVKPVPRRGRTGRNVVCRRHRRSGVLLYRRGVPPAAGECRVISYSTVPCAVILATGVPVPEFRGRRRFRAGACHN